MQKEILQLIQKMQLTSCMNNTRWRELVAVITFREDFDPPVRIKYLLEEKPSSGFSTVWWDEVQQIGFEVIEWIQIQPWREEHRGRLIKPQVIDYSEFIKHALERQNIPYELEAGIYTVYGYKKTEL